MKTLVSEIRYACAEDAAELSSVHRAAWQGAYAGLLPHRTLSDLIQRRDLGWWRRAAAANAAILVVEFAGTPVGYATIGQNRTPALAVGGEIFELYVRPEFQGVGLGRRLFAAARALLADRAPSGLAVWALADNRRALEFYASLGGDDAAEGSETFEGRAFAKIGFLWR